MIPECDDEECEPNCDHALCADARSLAEDRARDARAYGDANSAWADRIRAILPDACECCLRTGDPIRGGACADCWTDCAEEVPCAHREVTAS